MMLRTAVCPAVHQCPGAAAQAAPVRVVTSLTTYAAIAREVVGDQGTVTVHRAG